MNSNQIVFVGGKMYKMVTLPTGSVELIEIDKLPVIPPKPSE